MNGYGATFGCAAEIRRRSVDFPGVRITDQPGVRDRAQFENESPLLAFLALRVLARRTVARALEMDISFAALAPVTENKFFVRQSQIRDLLERHLRARSGRVGRRRRRIREGRRLA